MSVLTKKQVLAKFKNSKDSDLFCAYCYDKLMPLREGGLYCPNEMCLNERHYDVNGCEVEE